MELTPELVRRNADEYRESEPLYAVEQEQVDSLPRAFTSGAYGWRDTEWVVRWYFRRYLGEFPDADRRAIERRYGENDFEAVQEAIGAAVEADDSSSGLDALTDLEGVDTRIGSAFLFFIDPANHVVVGERVWSALHSAGELSTAYPSPPTATEYAAFLRTCRSLRSRLDVDCWTLYRACWRVTAGGV